MSLQQKSGQYCLFLTWSQRQATSQRLTANSTRHLFPSTALFVHSTQAVLLFWSTCIIPIQPSCFFKKAQVLWNNSAIGSYRLPSAATESASSLGFTRVWHRDLTRLVWITEKLKYSRTSSVYRDHYYLIRTPTAPSIYRLLDTDCISKWESRSCRTRRRSRHGAFIK